jgi:hypothetical protein
VAAGRKNVLTMTRNWEEEQSKAAIGHAAAESDRMVLAASIGLMMLCLTSHNTPAVRMLVLAEINKIVEIYHLIEPSNVPAKVGWFAEYTVAIFPIAVFSTSWRAIRAEEVNLSCTYQGMTYDCSTCIIYCLFRVHNACNPKEAQCS